MALATAYMKKAGYETGRYTGSEKLLMVATNADLGKKSAEVAANQFEKLGFLKLNFRIVPQDTLYTRFCNRLERRRRDLPQRRLLQGLLRPQSMLDPGLQRREHPRGQQHQLGPSSTTPRSTRRWSAPRSSLRELGATGPGARSTGWSRRWRRPSRGCGTSSRWIASKDVKAVANEYATGWDLSFSSLR